MKIAYVADSPLPYETAFLNELSKLVRLHVIYLSTEHALYPFRDNWGERPRFRWSRYWSKAIRAPWRDVWVQASVGVSAQLRTVNPDVVLCKSWQPIVLEPLLWAKATGRRTVSWSESPVFSGVVRGTLSNAARRLVLSLTDTFVSNGSQASAFLEQLHVAPERIVTSCLSNRITERAYAAEAYAGPIDATDQAPHFLYVGRLTPRKRPLELLDAFRSVLREVPTARLTIVGDGMLQPQVARVATEFGDAVTLRGRLEGEELSAAYRQADIFVMPALREVWGLVVNEALAHGLYVIATDQVASAYDLIDGTNGAIVPAMDQTALVRAMVEAARTCSRDPSVRASRAQRIAGRTPAAFAADVYRAARLAMNGRSPS